jgi:hypothetical protein
MFQPIISAYVIIKWIGAWSQFDGVASVCLFLGICIFAGLVFVTSLISPGAFRAISALINNGGGGLGVLLSPILWLIFFTLYLLGLVDWLVSLHILESNKGYLLSHKSPSAFDIVALVIVIAMFVSSILKVRKIIKGNGPS